MKDVKVNVSKNLSSTHSPANFSGDFLLQMDNEVLDNLRLDCDGDGYILRYHALRFRVSDEDREGIIRYWAVKDYDKNENKPKKLTPPYSKAEELMGKKFPEPVKRKSLIRRIFSISKK